MDIHGGRAYAEEWIAGVLPGCETSIGQALNDIESAPMIGNAGQTGWTKHKVKIGPLTKNIYHFSAGKMGTAKTCSIFFIHEFNQAYIIAVGQHVGASSYKIDFVRPSYLKNFPKTIDIAQKVELTIVQM